MSKQLKIDRYDLSNDNSLRAWSAADEFLLESFKNIQDKPSNIALYNDRFGYVACHLHSSNPVVIVYQKSQEKAISANLLSNELRNLTFANPIDALDGKLDLILMKVPKSTDLFTLYLEHIVHNSTEDVIVLCGFMTRHFTSKLIKIAEHYFDDVQQGRAVKKSRVLTLSKKKTTEKIEPISTLNFNDQYYKQYWGVFSGQHIDYATQFLLKNIELKKSDKLILDLGAGNGVIAKEILIKNPKSEIHLMDDSYLAVESAKLNVEGKNIHHHYDNDLSTFDDESLDLIVTNPPFHFEYEINIQVPIELFRQCHRSLKYGGSLQLVANKHLNYKTHLAPMFATVEVLAEDDKFVVYRCVK